MKHPRARNGRFLTYQQAGGQRCQPATEQSGSRVAVCDMDPEIKITIKSRIKKARNDKASDKVSRQRLARKPTSAIKGTGTEGKTVPGPLLRDWHRGRLQVRAESRIAFISNDDIRLCPQGITLQWAAGQLRKIIITAGKEFRK